MIQQSESALQSKVMAMLKKRGCVPMNIHGHAMQTTGLPDIVACGPQGEFIAIELKKLGKKPTLLQGFRLHQFRQNQALAGVAHTVREAEAICDGEPYALWPTVLDGLERLCEPDKKRRKPQGWVDGGMEC